MHRTLQYPRPEPSAGETLVVVTVDTEEDDWVPNRRDPTVENIRELPRFQAFCERMGARPTYFTAYQVVRHSWSAELMRGLNDSGRAEVAAHLHPWNTPPLGEEPSGRNTMLCNLPAELQRAKLETLTDRLNEVLGARPTTFRTGRFGLGPATIPALIRCGYRVDSSVTPFWSWRSYDDGPDFTGAPMHAYRLAGEQDPRVPSAEGELVELPVTAGFTRNPFTLCSSVQRWLSAKPLAALRAPAIASRLGGIRKVFLTPENETAEDMLLLSRRVVEQRVPHLNLLLHSSSLRPGLSPFTPHRADVERMYATLERYLEGLSRLTRIRFATVAEAAELTLPSRALETTAISRRDAEAWREKKEKSITQSHGGN